MSLEKIIPKDWDLINLSELTSLITKGTTPTTNGFSYLEDGVNFVKVESILLNGSFIPSKFAHVSDDCHDSFKRSQLKEGDILFTIAGALGRSAIVESYILPANTNQAVAIIRLKNLKNKEYIFHYLRGDYVKNLIEKINVSTAQANLSLGQINKFKIPLPPFKEQQKIAEILSTVDAKIAIIDQQITETQELKKGLMQRLLTKGIGHTEFKDSALGEIPVNWEVVKVNKISKVIDSLHKTPVFSEEGYPMVRVGDINKPKLNLDNCLKVGKEVYSDFSKNHKPTKGDILMTRVGSFGKTILVNTESNFCIGQNTVVITNIEESKYLYYTLNSFLIQKQLNLLTSGSSQPSLSLKNIRNLNILFPVKEEQQKIAEILSSVDEKLEVLSEKKETYQELKKGLMQQLLTGKVRVKV